MRLTRIEGLAPSVPYAYASITEPNARLVFLAGACPLDAAGRTVGIADVAGQAEACLTNLGLALAAAGAALTDVVFLRALVASSDRADLAVVWRTVEQAFAPDRVPGTLQGVTVLGWPDQLVELEAVASVADE